MFRTIRKKKNEISLEAVKTLLKSARRGVLAMNGDDGYPYAIPINFYYDEPEQKIFFHGTNIGHKGEAIKACDKICLTVYGKEIIKNETWAPYVQSAVVFGRCHLVEDPEETLALVKKFALKYYPDEKSVDDEIAISGKAVRMFVIDIEYVTGKEVQER